MVYDKEEKSRINREYYERTKKLKGRRPGGDTDSGNLPSKTPPPQASSDKVAAQVERLTGKVASLQKALSVAEAALSASRQGERKKARESSDGKSTVQEKQSSQKFRDKHQEELKAKAKQDNKSSSSSGGSSSSSSSSKSVSDMSTEELGSRIIKIKSALREANRQLSSAKQKLGQMTHSAIISDPKVNKHFARFQSERIPST